MSRCYKIFLMMEIQKLKKQIEDLEIENAKLKKFKAKVKESQKAFKNRAKGQSEWLRNEYPHIFEEQKHLDGGSEFEPIYKEDCVERVYWHYGYRVALLDVLGHLPKRV